MTEDQLIRMDILDRFDYMRRKEPDGVGGRRDRRPIENVVWKQRAALIKENINAKNEVRN